GAGGVPPAPGGGVPDRLHLVLGAGRRPRRRPRNPAHPGSPRARARAARAVPLLGFPDRVLAGGRRRRAARRLRRRHRVRPPRRAGPRPSPRDAGSVGPLPLADRGRPGLPFVPVGRAAPRGGAAGRLPGSARSAPPAPRPPTPPDRLDVPLVAVPLDVRIGPREADERG